MINKYLINEITKPKMTKLNIRMTEEMMSKIEFIKQDKGISKSKIIRLSLMQYLSDYESE